MAAHLVHNHGSTSKEPSPPAVGLQRRQLDRAREYIEENLGCDIGISDLAPRCALSRSISPGPSSSDGLAPHQIL